MAPASHRHRAVRANVPGDVGLDPNPGPLRARGVPPGRPPLRGWYGFGIDAATTARCIEGLRAAEREHGRPAHLGPLEVSVTPTANIRPDTVRDYADLGCHRLIFCRPNALEADALTTVEHIGALVKG